MVARAPAGSTIAHMPDPRRLPHRGTDLERSGGQASDRTDRHGRMRPEDVDTYQEASAIQILDALGMPRDELRAVVAADDPSIIHRHIELHRERLAERLADQLQTLRSLERTLNLAILDRRSASPSSRWSSQEVSDGTL